MSAAIVDICTDTSLRHQVDGAGVLIDVRSPGEFASAHLDRSVNIPLDLIETRAAEVAAALRSGALMICGEGIRAERAADLLGRHGCPVQVLPGGLRAWSEAGGAVVHGQGTWALDRQVRLAAGSMVMAGLAVGVVVPKARWLSAAVGAGLTYSALSNSCAMARVLRLLPYNRRAGQVDLDAALAALRAGR